MINSFQFFDQHIAPDRVRMTNQIDGSFAEKEANRVRRQWAESEALTAGLSGRVERLSQFSLLRHQDLYG
jgi:hypothetical protein